jgi:hypothetical protein
LLNISFWSELFASNPLHPADDTAHETSQEPGWSDFFRLREIIYSSPPIRPFGQTKRFKSVCRMVKLDFVFFLKKMVKMKRLFLIAAAVLLALFSNVSAQKAGNVSAKSAGSFSYESTLKFEGFIIEPHADFINEAKFIDKIEKAINLLKDKAPDEFKIMQANIVKIRATAISGANYNEEVMTIDIAERTFDASLEWLASVLIHETQHIKKYKDTGKKYGDAYLMKDKKAAYQVMVNEELECNKIQLAVLEKVGGSQFEIDYLKAQKGDHFDIDKDGDYDSDDYNNRSW